MTTIDTCARWENRLYRRISGVEYDEDKELLTVSFADNSVVTFDPKPIVPSDLQEIDWWRVASNHIEVIVPHESGWFEVPWDVIRRHTDEEYAEFWEASWLRLQPSDKSPVRAVREEPNGEDFS